MHSLTFICSVYWIRSVMHHRCRHSECRDYLSHKCIFMFPLCWGFAPLWRRLPLLRAFCCSVSQTFPADKHNVLNHWSHTIVMQYSIQWMQVLWCESISGSFIAGQSINHNQSIRPLVQPCCMQSIIWLHSRSFLRTLCTAQAFLSWGFAKLFAFWPLPLCTVTHTVPLFCKLNRLPNDLQCDCNPL